MEKTYVIGALLLVAVTCGCSSRGGSAAGGALGGAAIGAGAYEYNAYRQMQQLDQDYKTGKMNKQEYEIRKNQIEKGSLFQK
ncbi:lipoprotein, putative [Citrifermentans bemidjiense Bem]|uniref:Lipoprotein, putative n=1 Tax=Citrifermentans bemidjiense (strain ATCC BAA-1014 / DSM 16622 / JCM 12645 / Bem) TaxID=404380 RepID=B5ECC8_CITBB|nr:hypothetical protein [Citrifermentans bemidjiense]ACH37556.1 lipoprotein, putative [Citrifermentans bemidjiense Bem]